MGLIYCFRNKVNGKMYVGQTKYTLDNRIRHHKGQINDNSYFHRALKKYGFDNFEVTILEDNIREEELDAREVFWIDCKKSYVEDGGYNLTKGGQKSIICSGRKITSTKADEIKSLLKNRLELTMWDISNICNLSMT